MPLYHELRVKWSVFHRLLALTNERLRYGTPGLVTGLRRRQELLLDYSSLLRERGKNEVIEGKGRGVVGLFLTVLASETGRWRGLLLLRYFNE